MKYAITGHTSGIGKAVYDTLGENIIGFSKSTGYDITSKDDRIKILHEIEDCDVFINCASVGFAQTEMLVDYFDRYKDTDKTIVNIGSRVAEVTLPKTHTHLVDYQAQKRSLKITVDDLKAIECPINIRYIWFGYVGTERILKKYPDLTDYITTEECVKKILEESKTNG